MVVANGTHAGLLISALGILLTAAAAHAQDPDPGSVGGPPTRPERFEPGRVSDAVVIGGGPTAIGRVEVVAYDRRKLNLCIGTDFPDDVFTVVGCNRSMPRADEAISIGVIGSFGPRRDPRFTYVDGELSPRVASVSVRARRGERVRMRSALVSQAGPEVAARVNEDKPFGHFIAVFKRGIGSDRLRAIARDAEGNRIGTARPSSAR